MSQVVFVKSGKEKLEVPLPGGVDGTTLGQLRSQLAELTGFKGFKVLYSGGVMKADDLPLSSYGVKSRSVLAIVGSGKGADEVGRVERELKSKGAKGRNRKQPEEATEARTIESIKLKVQETKDNLGARMDQFKNAALHGKPKPPSSPEYAGVVKQHLFIGENLLQTLLWLDGVQCQPTWEEGRAERKAAVKLIQGYLDDVDAAFKTFKERSKTVA